MARSCGRVPAPVVSYWRGLELDQFSFWICNLQTTWFGVGFRARETKRKRTMDQKDERRSAICIQIFGQPLEVTLGDWCLSF